MEYLFSPKHFLKILWESEHFPLRYISKCEWVFFSEHSVDAFLILYSLIDLICFYF